jgi:hypothetical protein
LYCPRFHHLSFIYNVTWTNSSSWDAIELAVCFVFKQNIITFFQCAKHSLTSKIMTLYSISKMDWSSWRQYIKSENLMKLKYDPNLKSNLLRVSVHFHHVISGEFCVVETRDYGRVGAMEIYLSKPQITLSNIVPTFFFFLTWVSGSACVHLD